MWIRALNAERLGIFKKLSMQTVSEELSSFCSDVQKNVNINRTIAADYV